jgi:RNA polymerase sigma factor (sigma-70 family)
MDREFSNECGAEIRSDNSERWVAIAAGVRARDPQAIEELYSTFQKGFRFLILRQLGQDSADDSVHSCLVIVVEAVQKGKLRDASRLPAYAATVVRRHVIERIRALRAERNRETELDHLTYVTPSPALDPEEAAVRLQATTLAAKVLQAMSPRDREILRRFYLLGHSEEQIRVEMGLTANGFRNVKHRAKSCFFERLEKYAERRKGRLASLGNARRTVACIGRE